MRSPFTADYPPPPEPPARLDADIAPYWTIVAQQWRPDDEARDKILLGLLARADQSTVAPAVRARLVEEVDRVLAEHLPDSEGQCRGTHGELERRWAVLYPCWSVKYARLVTGEAPDSAGQQVSASG